MGILTKSGQSFDDNQIKSFFSSNPNNDQIAAAANQYGLTPDQVTSAMDTAGYGGATHDERAAAVNGYVASHQPQPTDGMTIGGKAYSAQQIKDFYAGGGDDNQFLQQHGITDGWQKHDLAIQARGIAGDANPTGEAALLQQFQRYQKYNPQGANANNYQGFVNDLGAGTSNAMRAGAFTGAPNSPKDYDFTGIYGPGSSAARTHGFASGLGPRGDGGSWDIPGASGGIPGTQGSAGAGGIIGSSSNTSSSTSGTYGGRAAPGVGPGPNGITPWNVTPEQTVEGRINAILNPNNPIIQQARTGALEQMNNRGLLNSSMATTASDAAAYQAAIPIAANDAATFAKAASYNADTPNQFQTNALNRAASLEQARIQAESSKYGADKSASTQLATAQLSADTNRLISSMDNAQKAQALQIQTANQTLLQTNSQAATAFNTGMNAIDRITQNNQMDAETKTKATAAVWQQVQSQLNVLKSTSGLDLTKQLNLAGYPGFDAQGNYVGFNAATPGTPAATPAPPGILGGSGIDYGVYGIPGG